MKTQEEGGLDIEGDDEELKVPEEEMTSYQKKTCFSQIWI